MHGLTLAFLGLAFAADPVELPKDVFEIPTKEFSMPLAFDPDRQKSIKRVRLFVSEDNGKTWRLTKNLKPTDHLASYTADRDGQYWFALQVEYKDGKSEPADVEDLLPDKKVYVNTERKALKAQKSYEELQHEVEELQKTVEELRAKLKVFEEERKPK